MLIYSIAVQEFRMPSSIYAAFTSLLRLGVLACCLCAGLTAHAAAEPAAPSASSASGPADPASAQADPLAQIWATRSGDVASLVDEVTALNKRAEEMAEPLADKLQNARTRFGRLSSLYEASKGHPTEQMTLIQQMHTLVQELRTMIVPLQTIAATLDARLGEIDAMRKSLQSMSGDMKSAGTDSADTQALARYSSSLDEARRTLAPASQRIAAMLTPARATLDHIDSSVTAVETSLISVWEKYYLTPSDNSLDALASTLSLLTEWVTSLYSRMGFAYPQTLGAWGYALKLFCIAAAFTALAGYIGLRGAGTLPERWRTAFERVIKGSWVWVGFGFSILAASTNQNGGVYFALVLVGSLFVIGGVAALSWRLRIALHPDLESQPSPLTRLYIPAAIGVLMLFSDLPTRILGIVWGVVMVAFVLKVFSVNRQHKIESALPLLERLAYGCAFWFGIASLLVTMAGYARMAILVFMALFAVVNTVILGSALIALFDLLADRIFSKTTKPVRNAVAQAVAIPVALVLSLVCTVPWIWAVPGARYLIGHFMSTDVTVGEATFDFSKLLIIVLLFFLFRSFISLARAFMEHLPDRVPALERGVVPPLRTLATYGLWAVFCMIALAMLGVNLTSLAVVAGGLSVGIGFGMQTIFNNLVSGLMLIFGRTILVGDYVDVAGASGTVRAINIRSTAIETPERALVYVPNSSIMAGQVTNWTRNSRMVRRSLNIGVAYGSDTALVTELLLEAAKKQEHVLQFPKAMVLFNDFGASSLDFTLNVFIDDFDNSTSAMSELRYAVEKKFNERGIDIPFPQLTLHMPSKAEEEEAPEEKAGKEPVTPEHAENAPSAGERGGA